MPEQGGKLTPDEGVGPSRLEDASRSDVNFNATVGLYVNPDAAKALADFTQNAYAIPAQQRTWQTLIASGAGIAGLALIAAVPAIMWPAAAVLMVLFGGTMAIPRAIEAFRGVPIDRLLPGATDGAKRLPPDDEKKGKTDPV